MSACERNMKFGADSKAEGCPLVKGIWNLGRTGRRMNVRLWKEYGIWADRKTDEGPLAEGIWNLGRAGRRIDVRLREKYDI